MATSSIASPESFWQEARWQRVCASCGQRHGRPDSRGRTWHPHHMVPRQLLRRLGLPQWDTRDALRLCTDCHMAFEWAGPGKIAVPVTAWTQQGICYCWEVLGVTAVQLEGKYGAFDIDPRWVLHLTEECPLCQTPPT